jgi:hypothetical protein
VRLLPRFLAIALAANAVTLLLGADVFAQTCLRPHWTECISFPKGGRHTGVDPYGKAIEAQIPAGAEICVINHSEIRAETYAEFARGGAPWPEKDWAVNAETFCFIEN